MTFSQLKRILQDENNDWFKSLPAVLKPSPDSDDAASITGTLTPGHGCYCFCGKLKGQTADPYDLARQTLLSTSNASRIYGVLNVLCNSSQNNSDVLPILLCVGINYTQFSTSPPQSTPLISKTGMDFFAKTAIQTALTHCNRSSSAVGAFHLVATNIFPWTTTDPWSELELNSVQEALLVHCFGDSDPVTRISNLIRKLSPKFTIFHGAGNCVPTYGVEIVRRAKAASTQTQWLFCDNLSRFRTPRNSVMLCDCVAELPKDQPDVLNINE